MSDRAPSAVEPRSAGAATATSTRAGTVAALVAPAIISIAVSAYLLSRPEFLTGVHSFTGIGYDDGVYLGAVERFVHGVLPYRSFTYVQPPGALLLLSPLGLIGRWFGTADALEVGRILTLIVAAANASLAAHLVRSRGRVAQAAAGLILAGFPLIVTADHTLNLEPYLVLVLLSATWLAFHGDRLVSGPRLVWAGVVMALAVEIKVWGAAGVVALAVVCLPDWRRLREVVLGLVAGSLVIAGPFVVAAPGRFWHQVVVAQVQRKDTLDTYSVVQRFAFITGVGGQGTATSRAGLGTVVMVAVIVVVLVGFGSSLRSLTRFDWYALALAVVLVSGLLASHQFYDHYTYATTAALALVVGVAVGRLARWRGHQSVLRSGNRWLVAVGATGYLLIAAVAVVHQDRYAKTFLANDVAVSPDIRAIVPAGACAVTDDPILLLDSDRWSSGGGCPAITDPFGMYVADDGTPPPGKLPFPASLTGSWLAAFHSAPYVVLSVDGSDYVPFDQQLYAYFHAHYTLIDSSNHAYIYARNRGG